jgi:hypothetical protein
MKAIWKVSAVAAALLGSAAAQADVVLPNTATGSSLVLFVRDISAGANPNRVFARDLGVLTDAVLTASAAAGAYAGPGSSIPFSLSTGADSALAAFLAGGSQFQWTVMGGDATGNAAFGQRYVTTTQLDVTTFGYEPPINTTLKTTWNQITSMYQTLNASLPDTSGSFTPTDGQWGQEGTSFVGMTDWAGGGVQNGNALGETANLYVFVTSSTGNADPARVFASTTRVRLNADGSLTSVGAPAVPLPPALWLLGSAIAGLTGVSRRKKVKLA